MKESTYLGLVIATHSPHYDECFHPSLEEKHAFADLPSGRASILILTKIVQSGWQHTEIRTIHSEHLPPEAYVANFPP